MDSSEVDIVNIKMHQTIKKVTEDIQEFKYNTAISAIMEYVNVLTEYRVSSIEYLKPLALLLAPFTPHLAEEVWRGVFSHKDSIHVAPWPKYDPRLIKEEEVTMVIQINGKMRSQIMVNSQRSKVKEEITDMAKSDQKVTKWLKGQKIKKVVFVPGKIINFVVQK